MKIKSLSLLVFSLCFLQSMGQNIAGRNEVHFNEQLEEKIRIPELINWLKLQRQRQLQGDKLDWQSFPKQNGKSESGILKADWDLGNGAEPFIAINPNNPDHLVITYIEDTGNSIDFPVFVSFDGGSNWTQSEFSPKELFESMNPGSAVGGGGDPTLAFDEDGNLYMTWIILAQNGVNFNGSMHYAFSEDGGETFIIPSSDFHVIYSGDFLQVDFLDRQWLAVDNSGGPYDGNLYMSCVYGGGLLTPDCGELVFRKTPTDSSLTDWSMAVPCDDLFTQFANIVVDENGFIHLTCIKVTINEQTGHVVYTRSTDGGESWSPVTNLASVTSALGDLGHVVHARDNSATSLAVDGQRLCLTWTDMADSDVHSFYAFSDDAGLNWTSPIEFGPNALDSSYYHLMPNIAADSSHFTLSWYAVDKFSLNSEYYIMDIGEDGLMLGDPQIISDGITDFTGATAFGSEFYGDYNTSVRKGCNTWSVWADGHTGSPHVYVTKINHCGEVTGISEVSAINASMQIEKVFPNPFSEDFSIAIDSKHSQSIQLDLLDLSGKKVLSKLQHITGGKNQKIVLEGIALSKGTYILKIEAERGELFMRTLKKQ